MNYLEYLFYETKSLEFILFFSDYFSPAFYLKKFPENFEKSIFDFFSLYILHLLDFFLRQEGFGIIRCIYYSKFFRNFMRFQDINDFLLFDFKFLGNLVYTKFSGNCGIGDDLVFYVS